MASHIHALRYSSNSNEIEVSIFVRKQPWSKKDIAYRFQLWPRYGDRFEEVDVDFIYPTLDLFDWTRLDRVICGFEARMKSTLKFWRARFCLLPAPIPNKRHIIATLVDELDEASNDEEVRLAGMLKMVRPLAVCYDVGGERSDSSASLTRRDGIRLRLCRSPTRA